MDLSTDTALSQARDHIAQYYSKVKIDVSVYKEGYVVDCIPFEQQPGLIDAPESEKRLALKRSIKVRNYDFDDLSFDFKATDCPEGDVGIPRPHLAHFTRGNHHALFKYPREMREASREGFFADSECREDISVLSERTSDGYAYVVSPLQNIVADSVSVTLGLGPVVGEPPPVLTPGLSHSLNQLWWLTTPGKMLGSETVSLETGWIRSNYWPPDAPVMRTSLFAFSTPDGYGNDKLRNLYNYQGGFIGYKNALTLETPVNNVNYKFSYRKISLGYELTLQSFHRLENGVYDFGSVIPVGYYPMSHYVTPPNFSYLQVGSEVFLANGATSSMAGRLYGYSAGLNNYPVKDSEKPFYRVPGANFYSCGYLVQEWVNSALNDFVRFHWVFYE